MAEDKDLEEIIDISNYEEFSIDDRLEEGSVEQFNDFDPEKDD